MAKGATKGIFNSIRGGLARTTMGPKAWGLAAMLPGQLRALQFALPAIGLGALGLHKARRSLTNAPYDMEGNGIQSLGQSTNLIPQRTNMEFGSFKRSYLDMNASGSLAFALHNRR